MLSSCTQIFSFIYTLTFHQALFYQENKRFQTVSSSPSRQFPKRRRGKSLSPNNPALPLFFTPSIKEQQWFEWFQRPRSCAVLPMVFHFHLPGNPVTEVSSSAVDGRDEGLTGEAEILAFSYFCSLSLSPRHSITTFLPPLHFCLIGLSSSFTYLQLQKLEGRDLRDEIVQPPCFTHWERWGPKKRNYGLRVTLPVWGRVCTPTRAPALAQPHFLALLDSRSPLTLPRNSLRPNKLDGCLWTAELLQGYFISF